MFTTAQAKKGFNKHYKLGETQAPKQGNLNSKQNHNEGFKAGL